MESHQINQADSLQPLGTKLQGSFSEPFANWIHASLHRAGLLTVQTYIQTEKALILFVADAQLDMSCSFNCLIAIWQ